MLVERARLSWIAGEQRIQTFQTPSGFKSEFCGNCGSPVPNRSMDGKHYWVPAGLLEEPMESNVVAHVYVDSRSSWDTAFLNDTAPKYSEMPSSGELWELLHRKRAHQTHQRER